MEMNLMTESFMECLSALLFITAVLTALTNIIVEVFKGLLPKIPTALLVYLVAEGITLLSLTMLSAWTGKGVTWYYICAAAILGIVVAYAAMGNFDKLKEIVFKFKNRNIEI